MHREELLVPSANSAQAVVEKNKRKFEETSARLYTLCIQKEAKAMKKLLMWGSIILFIISFTGCLNVKTVIKLKPDGSGTLEETFLMQKEILQMMKSMAAMGSEETEEQAAGFSLLDEKKLKEGAKGMGAGVSFVSAAPFSNDEFEGYKAVYAFSDINKLKVNQNPGSEVPFGQDGGNIEYLTFSFKKGNPASLKIIFPKQDSKASKTDTQAQSGNTSEEDIESMKQIYEKMKLSMELEVQGTISKTNASYRSGSTITLMEMDFGLIMKNEKKFLELTKANVNTIEGMKQLVKDVPGLKLETKETVEVLFK